MRTSRTSRDSYHHMLFCYICSVMDSLQVAPARRIAFGCGPHFVFKSRVDNIIRTLDNIISWLHGAYTGTLHRHMHYMPSHSHVPQTIRGTVKLRSRMRSINVRSYFKLASRISFRARPRGPNCSRSFLLVPYHASKHGCQALIADCFVYDERSSLQCQGFTDSGEGSIRFVSA